MRRFIPIAVAGVALVLAAPASTATSTVQIKSTGFVPASVTINQNDSVTWTNTDTKDHQVVANGGSFASAILTTGKSYTHAFRSGWNLPLPRRAPSDAQGNDHVRGASPRCTLATSVPVVKFGTQVTLTGTVSNRSAPAKRSRSRRCRSGRRRSRSIATLQTTRHGAFSFNVTPQLNTTYQAQWKGCRELGRACRSSR